MKERIFGVECEYAPAYHSRDDFHVHRLSGEALLDHTKGLSARLFSSLAHTGYLRAGEFLGNGGRLYIDRGGHPEFATPECLHVKDLVAYEKAGDRIVQELAVLTNRRDAVRKQMPHIHIYKNNVDLYGHTYGGHENYLVAPRAAEKIHHIIPFLATRQIFAGAGRVLTCRECGAPSYQISQRAEFIDRTFSDRSTRVRGIINTRKREIYRQEQNRRLHIIVGDSNMSEFAIALKVGTILLVLRVLEEGRVGGFPALAKPVDALKEISRNWCGDFQMMGGKGRYTALDVQAVYLEIVQRFFSLRRPSPDEALAMDLWQEVLSGMDRLKISGPNWKLEDDPAYLRRKIDWIFKLWLLNRYGNMDEPVVNDRRLKLMDLKYHDLNPATGLFKRCETSGLMDRLVDDGAIDAACIKPPQNTRAWIRGAVIRKTAGKPVAVEIENWEKINIRAEVPKDRMLHPFKRYKGAAKCLGICLDDPFKAQDPLVFEQLDHFIPQVDKPPPYKGVDALK